MKKNYKVTSLLLFILLYCSCNSIKKEEPSPDFIKKTDSLTSYYIISKKSTSLTKAVEAIDNYIYGSISLKIDSFTYKGYMYKTRILGIQKKYKEAIKVSEQLLEYAKKNNDSSYIGKAYNKLGIYYSALNNYTKAFNNYNTSFQVHRKLKDSSLAVKRLFSMANTQKTLGDYTASTITATDGLKYLSNSSDLKIRVALYHTIAVCYREMKNYKQALLWNEKTLSLVEHESFREKIKPENIVKFKITNANILADLHQFEEATSILEILLVDPLIIQNENEKARVLSNLGKIRWLNNKNNSTSESLFLDALKIRQKNQYPADLIASNIHLSKYYSGKDNSKAIKHAKEAYRNSKLINNPLSILESLDHLTTIDTNAVKEYREFKNVSKSLVETQKKIRQIYAPTKFENDRLTQEKIQKEQQLKNERNYKKWLIIIFSFIIISIIIYTIQRSKIQKERDKLQAERNKVEKILTAYHAETRISKKVHDTIASDIYLIKKIIADKPNIPIILKKLNAIYNKARDISRENTDIDFEFYEIELKELISSYISDSRNIYPVDIDHIQWVDQSQIKKIVIYKVIQELMINMDKYSNATIVSITFKQNKNNLLITYTDNGVGINWNAIKKKNGLHIMENHIENIDGHINFDITREKGVKAIIIIPNDM
ncbi:tetratricopeptide repeat-containing sensor histidine kinase [uncultured Dokdonia sp.]|uniref:tetratricopeptide repeat-containing sensor histidine kinase n=1 Tax=uncultured Dokdonia sp. TaxID=575653 RepID=UPI00261F535D|nr:tetratricopeptide repeat-containing sensor histidine kinase [uncultured Dokdonia sp.]